MTLFELFRLLKIIKKGHLEDTRTILMNSKGTCIYQEYIRANEGEAVRKSFNYSHGRNLVGDGGDMSPHFFTPGGQTMFCPPPLFDPDFDFFLIGPI